MELSANPFVELSVLHERILRKASFLESIFRSNIDLSHEFEQAELRELASAIYEAADRCTYLLTDGVKGAARRGAREHKDAAKGGA